METGQRIQTETRRDAEEVMRFKYYYIVQFLCAVLGQTVFADTPLPPPETHTVASRNFDFGAERNPKTNETVVYRLERGSPDGRVRGETLWKFPKWFRDFRLSNDGRAIVAGPDYLNLLPPDIAKQNPVLLTFIFNGRVIREVTLKQLLASETKLTPTASHLYWGRLYEEMDPNDRVMVDTVIGFFVFDAKTAKCVFSPSNAID